MLSGSLCHSPQQPIEVCQLAPRPVRDRNGRLHYVLAGGCSFSLIGRCLQKVRLEGCTVVLVTSVWDVQPSYPVLLDLKIEYPLLLPSHIQLLVQQGTPICATRSAPASHVETIRETHLTEGISERASVLIWSGWSKGTNTAYQSGWARWSSWCAKRQIDPISGDGQHFLSGPL